MHRLFIASIGVASLAGGGALLAKHAGIAHTWAVFAGLVAAWLWIAFERRTRG